VEVVKKMCNHDKYGCFSIFFCGCNHSQICPQ